MYNETLFFLEDFNMNNAISKLFRLRKALDECERELGLNELF